MRVTLPDMKTIAFGLEPIGGGNAAKLLAIRDQIVHAINAAGASAAPQTANSPAAQASEPPTAAPTTRETPSPTAPEPNATAPALGPAVVAFANDLFKAAVDGGAKIGEKGLFWQAFDADPDDRSAPFQLYEQRLARDAARTFVKSRIDGGAQGIAGFSWLEESETICRLHVEAFDVRDSTSVSLSGILRRTLRGKYRPAASPTVHGPAAPL